MIVRRSVRNIAPAYGAKYVQVGRVLELAEWRLPTKVELCNFLQNGGDADYLMWTDAHGTIHDDRDIPVPRDQLLNTGSVPGKNRVYTILLIREDQDRYE